MYDLIIIGSGPAGLTSSIYASCFHLSHIVIGKVLGGQMSLAPDILNYPGFLEITGKELTEKMASQAKERGAEIITDSVVKVEKNEDYFTLTTEQDKTFEAKTIILATGCERRKLNVKGEAEYTGKGVHYCVPCERLDYIDKIIAVAGGANSATTSAVHLAQKASKVYIIYRGRELRCDPIWFEQIKNDPKIEVLYQTAIEEIIGDGEKVTGIKIKSHSSSNLSNTPNPSNKLPLDKVYIEIGGVPGTALLIQLGVEVDPGGYIKVNDDLATNIPGIFAAGDVISYKLSIEQISSAVGLGARASMSVFSYLKGQKSPTVWGTNQIQR
ncbi:MAG: FAD-dependent oxidoreductase [bacterium]|nr:FAD-dependent oxidoreductase [bacterium]